MCYLRDLFEFATAIADRAGLRPQSSAFVASPAVPIGSGVDPFVLQQVPARWGAQPVLIDIQTGGQPGLAGGGLTELAADRAAWNSAGGQFTYTVRSSSVASRCGEVYHSSGIVAQAFNDPCAEISNTGGTLALTYTWFMTTISETVSGQPFRRMLESTVVTNDGSTAQPYLQNSSCFAQVLLHELGHALGLGHSADSNAIMFSTVTFAQCSTSFRTLNSDDRAGLQFIYLGAAPPPVTLLPPTNLTATVSGNSVTISFTAASGAATYRLVVSGPGVRFDQNIGGLTTVSGSGLPAGLFVVQVYSVATNGTLSDTFRQITYERFVSRSTGLQGLRARDCRGG